MSEEEKKTLEWFKEDLAKEKENCGNYNEYKKQVIKRDEKLLELIEEQQKEIEELERDRILLIQGHKMAKHNLIVLDGREYISKDKIREKIKELEQIKNTALTERTVEMMEDKVNILNLVLEENK